MKPNEQPNSQHSPGSRLWIPLIIVCVITVLASGLKSGHGEHVFPLQDVPFYPVWIGLGAGILTVLVSRLLGVFLLRAETYYDKDDHTENEDKS